MHQARNERFYVRGCHKQNETEVKCRRGAPSLFTPESRILFFLIPSAKSGTFVKTAGRECATFAWGMRKNYIKQRYLQSIFNALFFVSLLFSIQALRIKLMCCKLYHGWFFVIKIKSLNIDFDFSQAQIDSKNSEKIHGCS